MNLLGKLRTVKPVVVITEPEEEEKEEVIIEEKPKPYKGKGIILGRVIHPKYEADPEDYRTPDKLFNKLNEMYGPFTLDAAASDLNYKVDNYFTKEDNALEQDWTGKVWINPPYGRDQRKFAYKAYEEVFEKKNAELIVLLVPCNTRTRVFHDLYLPFATHLIFIKGTIAFGGPNLPENNKTGANFASVIVVFKQSPLDETVNLYSFHYTKGGEIILI